MLVRMHRMTKDRLKELSRSQRKLAMGRMKMGLAHQIADHLALTYAIQTEHPLVKERFSTKQIVLREDFFEEMDRAQDLLVQQIEGQILFSVRVRQNAMKLAGALTLFSFFQQDGQRLEMPGDARKLALKFFVEEIAVRQKVALDIDNVLSALGLGETRRAAKASG